MQQLIDDMMERGWTVAIECNDFADSRGIMVVVSRFDPTAGVVPVRISSARSGGGSPARPLRCSVRWRIFFSRPQRRQRCRVTMPVLVG